MLIDQVILDELKKKCSEFEQSEDFYKFLENWLVDLSESEIDQDLMISRLEILLKKIETNG